MLGAQQISKLSPIYASRTPSPLDTYQQQYGMQGVSAVYPSVSTASTATGPVYTPFSIPLEQDQSHSHQPQLLSEATNILNMDTHVSTVYISSFFNMLTAVLIHDNMSTY